MYTLIRRKLGLIGFGRKIAAAETELDAARQLSRIRVAKLKASLHDKLSDPSNLATAFLLGFAVGLLPPRRPRDSGRRSSLIGSLLSLTVRPLITSLITAYMSSSVTAQQSSTTDGH